MRRHLAVVFLVAVAGCGGAPAPSTTTATRPTTAEDTDRDGVPDSRDPAPFVASIRTKADAARAKRIEERGKRERAQPEQPEATSDHNAREITFFERMDDDAIALDSAISRLQDGDRSALATIARLRRQIRDRVNARLLRGEDTSVGANLILSGASEARAAANADDARAMVRAREYVREGRQKLADEITG